MKEYSVRFDSMYDLEKDVWLESQCSDSNCEYCSERPEKPSEVEEL